MDDIRKGAEAPVSPHKYSNYQVNITDTFYDPEPIVKQGDRSIVSRGNIAAITGKSKSFKTFLTSAIAAAFLEDECLSLSGPGGKVLFIDTEQSKSHCNIVQKRIYRLCGWDQDKISERLIYLSLRELNAEERLEIVKEAIKDISPDLVIIDGIRDLINDFNDIGESSGVITLLMSLSTEKNCGIVTVLHQNKSDNNARGHLGTELCNKSETVLQVAREDGIATVSPVFSRNQEIEPFSFRIGVDGLPEGCLIPKDEHRKEELRTLMQQAMSGSSVWTKKNLIERVAEVDGRSSRTARRKVDEAIQEGILTLNKVGHLYIKTEDYDDFPTF